MSLEAIRVDTDAFPPVAMSCLRCGAETMMRFAGPCPACTAELRAKFADRGREVEDAAYEPKMNVTPNAVAVKDD